MFGDRRLLHAQAVHNVSDGTFLKDEKIQDSAATGFGDGVEGVRGCGSTRHERIIHAHMGICQQEIWLEHRWGPSRSEIPGSDSSVRRRTSESAAEGESNRGGEIDQRNRSGWELLNVNVRGLSVAGD